MTFRTLGLCQDPEPRVPGDVVPILPKALGGWQLLRTLMHDGNHWTAARVRCAHLAMIRQLKAFCADVEKFLLLMPFCIRHAWLSSHRGQRCPYGG